MDADGGKKCGNLTLLQGGLAGPRAVTPEVRLERDLRARFVAMRGKDGKVVGRAFHDIACGHQNPWRILARRIREAQLKRVPREQVKGIVADIDAYVDRLYGMSNTGEHKPAA